MKKRECDICGRIYDSETRCEVVMIERRKIHRTPDVGECFGKEKTQYDLCLDCYYKQFNLIRDEIRKREESDGKAEM